MFAYDTVKTEGAGDHLEGSTRLAQEESRKNKYYGAFHTNKESVQENHGDRNKMGNRSQEPHGNYE